MFPAPGNSASDRACWDAQQLGDLVVVAANDVAQNEGESKVLGKVVQRLGQDYSVGDLRIMALPWEREVSDDVGRNGPPFAAPELIEAGVGCYSVSPGGELGSAIEPGEPADNGEQRLLTPVGGIGIISHDPPTDGVNAVVFTFEQPVHGGAVAPLGGMDQFDLLVSGRVHSTITSAKVKRFSNPSSDSVGERPSNVSQIRTCDPVVPAKSI